MLKLLVATCTCAVALSAGEPLDLATHGGRTLPAEAYRLLKKGGGRESLSWAWKSPAFKPADGYSVEETRWDWDERNGVVLRYLREQLELQARPEAQTRLAVRVVYYAVNSAGPTIILEGALRQGNQPMGYFVANVILDPGESLAGLVDEFMRDFSAYLR
jgi:hypothetical protein